MEDTVFNNITNGFVTVQMYNNNHLPFFGASTTLLVNPMSITLYGNNSDNSDIEIKKMKPVGENVYHANVCFTGFSSNLSSIRCVYWDDINYLWSSNGVSLSNSDSKFTSTTFI